MLDAILANKRDEVTMLHRPSVRATLRSAALDAPVTRPFADALRPADGTLAVIAEIKRRSPSKGDLAPDLDPVALARQYASGGAAALSVLTDQPFFGGTIDDLVQARAHCSLPVLRKDFIIDEIQVFETRALGADALLLILAALPDDHHVRDLHDCAIDLGLAVLTEVHTGAELARAIDLGVGIIGVNARDLDTFAEHLDGAVALAAQIPGGTIAVAESAIRAVDDAQTVAQAGFDAMLVGEYLVRSGDPSQAVEALSHHRRTGRAST
ncbi:MAG: indole-3-glycerol phosphate synthase TrpC [Acidimicrobiia bacterium]